MTANLKTLVEDSLTKDGWPPLKIETAVRLFDPNITLGEFFSVTSNCHLVQAKGFPSFKIMQAAFDDSKIKPEWKKAKKALIPLTARYLLSLVKANDSLMLDGTKDDFLAALKTYVKPCSGDKAESVTNDVLRGIRSFGLLNAQFYLASENASNLITLQELSAQSDETCQRFDVPTKELEKCIRTCKTSKAEVDLFRNEQGFQFSLNCNHCVTSIRNPNDALPKKLLAQYKDPATLGPGHGFVNKAMALFNANKAVPLDSTAAIRKHYEDSHRKGEPFALLQSGNHNLLLWCKFCSRDPTLHSHAFICCL